MKTKHIVIVILALLMLSSTTLLATVKASAAWPNLPLTTVQLTVVNGTGSYFISTLSGVPVGFAVSNGVYPGWCVDTSTTMTRSVSHNVTLYSSLSPPAALSGINWIAINYILNHDQGFSMNDVQQAIWVFTDGYAPYPAIQALVNAANANPTYDPTTGEVLAIICLKQNDPHAQNTIIALGLHDVIVTNTIAPSWVYQDILVIPHDCVNISVTVDNMGASSEDAWVTLYYNTTSNQTIGAYPVDLDSEQNFTLVFVWNTAWVPCGNYTLTAVVTTPTGLNTFTVGNMVVRLVGDVNGDGRVDLKDIALVAHAFGSTPGSPNWNPAADINGDGTVNMQDIALVARHFGQQLSPNPFS